MPEPDAIRIVRLAPEETGAFCALFDEVWPDGAPHAAQVEWAFRSAWDRTGIILGVFAEEGAETTLVGARGSIPWPLVFEGVRARACQLHGTCVSTRHRRLGLFSKANLAFLESCRRAGGEVIFNVSVRASRAGYEKLGWTYLPGLRRLLRFVRPGVCLGALMRAGRRFRGAAVPASPRPPGQAQPAWGSVKHVLALREEAMGAAAHTQYDEAFYEWRFSGRHARYGWAGNESVGFCVYRSFSREGLREVLIGDVWPIEWSRGGVETLLDEVFQRETPDISSIVLTSGHPLRRHLSRCWWLPDPRGDLSLGVRPISDRARFLLNGPRWAIASGDIDTF